MFLGRVPNCCGGHPVKEARGSETDPPTHGAADPKTLFPENTKQDQNHCVLLWAEALKNAQEAAKFRQVSCTIDFEILLSSLGHAILLLWSRGSLKLKRAGETSRMRGRERERERERERRRQRQARRGERERERERERDAKMMERSERKREREREGGLCFHVPLRLSLSCFSPLYLSLSLGCCSLHLSATVIEPHLLHVFCCLRCWFLLFKSQNAINSFMCPTIPDVPISASGTVG